MDQKVIIRIWWEFLGLSSASRNHLTTFCRPFVHCACLRMCSAMVHFIRNNCLYFDYYGWSGQVLTVLDKLPNSVAWQNCCTSSKTTVFKIEAFRHFIMSEQGKRKTKFSWLLYITKNWKFSCVLYAHSQVVCSRVANLDFLKPDFEILAFLEIKMPEKSGFFWLIFSRIGLALAKPCLSCVFITNLLRRGSISMQGAQNIAKILLLP